MLEVGGGKEQHELNVDYSELLSLMKLSVCLGFTLGSQFLCTDRLRVFYSFFHEQALILMQFWVNISALQLLN